MSRLVTPVPITLDRARLLKCNFNALAYMKEWTGRNMFRGQDVLQFEAFDITPAEPDKPAQRGMSFDPMCLRAVLAALLKQDDPAMTPELAGDLIDAENMADVIAKCSESVFSFFPDKKAEAPRPLAATETASTSMTSGPLPDSISASQTPSSGA